MPYSPTWNPYQGLRMTCNLWLSKYRNLKFNRKNSTKRARRVQDSLMILDFHFYIIVREMKILECNRVYRDMRSEMIVYKYQLILKYLVDSLLQVSEFRGLMPRLDHGTGRGFKSNHGSGEVFGPSLRTYEHPCEPGGLFVIYF